MAGPNPPQRGGRRPRGLKETLKAFRSGSMQRLVDLILSRYRLHLFAVMICIAAAAVADVRGTLFLRSLIDDYIMPIASSSSPDYGPLAAALVRVAGIYLIGIAAGYTYNRLMVSVSQGTLRTIRTDLFNHMQSLPISYFDTHAHGDIMSVYTNDTDTLRQFIGQAFPQLMNSIISIVSVFISMCILNIPLTMISLCMTFGILFATGKIASLSGKHFGEQQRNLGKLNGYIEEMMSGARVVKVFSHEEKSIAEFKAMNENLRGSAFKANSMANVLMPITAQLGNLDYVIVAVIGACFAVSGRFSVTIGVLVSFLTLNKNFNRPFSQISMQMNSVVMASAGAERIYALMDEKPETDEGSITLVKADMKEDGTVFGSDSASSGKAGLWAFRIPGENGEKTEYRELCGEIRMENVDFGYVPEKTVLHNIDLYAHRGQKIAFVGSTGAGKTTITNLINRFYEIRNGSILYDGIDIRKIRKNDLRRSLGIVLQETNLFTGTVMENIRFGRLDATDAECRAAAKLANADGFIERLPQGYDTVLTGNGARLSQGQRQLLAIARAAVADPPVLILDEATSSIDTRTEQLVQRGMDSLMIGRTTFVIAHRLSTVKNSDCIMVLENGRIIERGSHDELLKAKGRYYRLYTGRKE